MNKSQFMPVIVFCLMFAVLLGLFFSSYQFFEYKTAVFDISDSVYGSIFYLATGFHGFHVIIGTIFLFSMLLRAVRLHFNYRHFFGLEAAIWYWHFVDVV
jgi:cytochrome c oxidase subunit 3